MNEKIPYRADQAGSLLRPAKLKTARMEYEQGTISGDELHRIEEAARIVDIDQLCISPQCGFSSTEEGNILTEADQWNKLKLTVDIAKEVWGET
jgi:methionine synthase II (cobalamin-independent)